MTGDYKLLKSINGRMNFARVVVEVEYTTNDTSIEVDIQSPVNTEKGEVDSLISPSWIDSAIAGVEEGIKILEGAGILREKVIVKISKVIGTTVDTSESAVFSASAMATCIAFEPDKKIAEFYEDEGKILIRAVK